MNRHIITLTCVVVTLILISCHDEWLDIKRDKKLVVPHTLDELQALLDNTSIMNSGGTFMGEVSADNYYMLPEHWQLVTTIPRNAYIWAEDIYEGDDGFDWERGYQRIFYANTVLDGLKKIDLNETGGYTKGRALFYRAWSFYQMAQIFCKPYDPSTADIDLGLPLRLESDIAITYPRASVQQTYDRIIKDLEDALPLLPKTPIVKTRPGKAAVYGLLARTYLQMERYERALEYADSCLKIQRSLLDYNTLDTEASYPIPRFNEEVIFHHVLNLLSPLGSSVRLKIDPDLFNSYHADDLRKSVFFRGNDGSQGFKGSYYGGIQNFDGLATDELYLIRAECHARAGNLDKAMSDLNALLEKRYLTGTFVPISATDAEDALIKVLAERRKELVFRGLRWPDLRRLNKDPRFAKTITRSLDGEIFELPPNSPRYVLPIPQKVIELSGIKQNER